MTNLDNDWDQPLPGETSKAWLAFCCYRDLGPTRTQVKAYQIYKRRKLEDEALADAMSDAVPGHFYGWSKKYRWVERTTAYDAFVSDLVTNDVLNDYRAAYDDLRKFQLDWHNESKKIAREALELVRTRIASLKPDDLGPAVVPRYLKEITDFSLASIEIAKEALAVDLIIEKIESERKGE